MKNLLFGALLACVLSYGALAGSESKRQCAGYVPSALETSPPVCGADARAQYEQSQKNLIGNKNATTHDNFFSRWQRGERDPAVMNAAAYPARSHLLKFAPKTVKVGENNYLMTYANRNVDERRRVRDNLPTAAVDSVL